MKGQIVLLVLLALSLFVPTTLSAQQEGVFYSIRRSDAHLVTIDTTGTVSAIGPIGFPLDTAFQLTMDFDRCGKLYMVFRNVLYNMDLATGAADTISVITGAGVIDYPSISFNANNELFLLNEKSNFAVGELNKLNVTTGVATRVSGSNTGTPSLVGIEFDNNGVLWAGDQLNNRLAKLNASGVASSTFANNSIGFSYPTDLDYMPGNDSLWAIDINNDTATSIKIYTVNRTTGAGYLRFSLNGMYLGLASFSSTTLPAAPTITATNNASFCPGGLVTLTASSAGNYLWSSGETTQSIITNVADDYFVTTTDAFGCTSLPSDTVEVVALAVPNFTMYLSLCPGDTFEGYSTNGIYIDTFASAAINGCDSIRTLHLTILPPSTSNIVQSICAGNSFEGYTTTGIYIDTFANGAANACDSIRTIDLTVVSITKPTINQTSDSLSIADNYNSYQWYLNGDSIDNTNYAGLALTSNGQYYVIVTGASGCTETSDTITVTGVGIGNTFEANSLKVYPNPTNGLLHIELSNASATNISMYSISGEQVNIVPEAQSNGCRVDLSQLASGVYVLRIATAQQSHTLRVVVE